MTGALSPAEQLREPLHDAEEGLLGFDPISPLKPLVGEAFLKLMDRMQRVIFAKYCVTWWTREGKALHKKADILAAASEAIHVAGWSRDELRNVLQINVEPLQADPLVKRYGGAQWQPWSIEDANGRYLAELMRLLAL